MKYIDADKLKKLIDEKWKELADKGVKDGGGKYEIEIYTYLSVLRLIDSLQQEQPDDLASLISEATNVAKRIVDWDSFYNSLPQNLRNKYTSKAWREILEALSTMKGQKQPEKAKKNCNSCPHCVDRKDQYGWHFKGCFGGSYNGKFIAEIDECPLQREQPKPNLENEIKDYTETLYQETFGNGQGTLDEFDWEDIVQVIDETARYFYNLNKNDA